MPPVCPKMTCGILEARIMTNHVKWPAALVFVCAAAGVCGYASRPVPAALPPGAGQDIMSVDRRVSTLEQRMYTIDSHINQLQQQVMMINRTPAPPAGASGDVGQLRVELDLLRNRINQIECAIAKLDERTLQPGKPKRSVVKDPCRQDSQTPIEMPGHPY